VPLEQDVAPALARAEAHLLASIGAIIHAPHGQNFLLEVRREEDGRLVPTGRIFLRDLQDLHFFRAYFPGLPPREIADFPLRMDDKAGIAIGITHGTQRPSWLDAERKMGVDRIFMDTFQEEYGRLAAVPAAAFAGFRRKFDERKYSALYLTADIAASWGRCRLARRGAGG
jgi:hypothetical protein